MGEIVEESGGTAGSRPHDLFHGMPEEEGGRACGGPDPR
jgi:hypothetical protein